MFRMTKGSETGDDDGLGWMMDYMAKWPLMQEMLWYPPKVDVGQTPHDIVWQKDMVSLLHYRPVDGKKAKGNPLLIVYALINKPYILDLEPKRSVVEALLQKGNDIYMIDWGSPEEGDRYLCTEDYVERYMDEIVDWIRESRGLDKISLMGYCIGGTLVSIYASIHPEKIQNLIVMAGPIDFSTDQSLLNVWTSADYFEPAKFADALGLIPVDLFTTSFMMLDPVANMHLKYVDLWENADNEKFVETFFRMEKWIHDGVPMTGAFYKELIGKWYQQNQLASGKLEVNGAKVDLGDISMPLLTITGSRDHIVPPESTEALLDLVSSKDKDSIRCDSGHIGLSVGGMAHKQVWPNVADWLKRRSGRRTKS